MPLQLGKDMEWTENFYRIKKAPLFHKIIFIADWDVVQWNVSNIRHLPDNDRQIASTRHLPERIRQIASNRYLPTHVRQMASTRYLPATDMCSYSSIDDSLCSCCVWLFSPFQAWWVEDGWMDVCNVMDGCSLLSWNRMDVLGSLHLKMSGFACIWAIPNCWQTPDMNHQLPPIR